MTDVISELIYGGEPEAQVSGFTSGASEYNASGGRRRGTRKSCGKKRKGGGKMGKATIDNAAQAARKRFGGKGSRRKTAKKGKKSGKSRKSNRK